MTMIDDNCMPSPEYLTGSDSFRRLTTALRVYLVVLLTELHVDTPGFNLLLYCIA